MAADWVRRIRYLMFWKIDSRLPSTGSSTISVISWSWPRDYQTMTFGESEVHTYGGVGWPPVEISWKETISNYIDFRIEKFNVNLCVREFDFRCSYISNSIRTSTILFLTNPDAKCWNHSTFNYNCCHSILPTHSHGSVLPMICDATNTQKK
jgi:hypothetical protein